MQYDNGRTLKNIIPNGALYCSVTGCVLSRSPGSNQVCAGYDTFRRVDIIVEI